MNNFGIQRINRILFRKAVVFTSKIGEDCVYCNKLRSRWHTLKPSNLFTEEVSGDTVSYIIPCTDFGG